jgi:hypothetical protein
VGLQDTSYDWNVTTMSNQDILINPNFHFHIVNANGTDAEQESGGFWSLGFVLKNDQTLGASSTISSSPTSSSLTSSTLTSTTSSTLSTSTASASPTSTSSSSGLSSGSKAGIAIGVVIPVTIALALGIVWFWWQKKKIYYQADAQAKAQQQQQMGYGGGGSPYGVDSVMYAKNASSPGHWNDSGYAVVSHEGPVELPSSQKPVEMDGRSSHVAEAVASTVHHESVGHS